MCRLYLFILTCYFAGRLLTALLCEYMDWAQLNHTLKVYLPECNMVTIHYSISIWCWCNSFKWSSIKNPLVIICICIKNHMSSIFREDLYQAGCRTQGFVYLYMCVWVGVCVCVCARARVFACILYIGIYCNVSIWFSTRSHRRSTHTPVYVWVGDWQVCEIPGFIMLRQTHYVQ